MKKYIGVQILPGVVAHVVKDVSPETIEALKVLILTVQKMPDEELREIELYADYLQSKHKKKIGRPRKAKVTIYLARI